MGKRTQKVFILFFFNVQYQFDCLISFFYSEKKRQDQKSFHLKNVPVCVLDIESISLESFQPLENEDPLKMNMSDWFLDLYAHSLIQCQQVSLFLFFSTIKKKKKNQMIFFKGSTFFKSFFTCF